MPTYQYACTACGHQLEAVQTFADEALSECPACEGRLRKLFSGVGVVFKGSGFYRTDSRAAASSSSAPAQKSSDTANKSDSNKSDSSKPSSSSSSSSSTSTAAA